ncbi:YbhB/YbcL family Raf kinase inhibitor-like protein [Thioalkalivibrio sp. ALMg9]|uniref:YbhB/YbcL family Raf kinase inhibitor-like protein n=1 Tax=Thioalkalivibrio sp. ALMg9 TaxID=1266912 RepID=UPI0003653306|nr:YbhB/YbcL family Raf kinase inhibitor-like protein [Thioalkalivibrio sp. ALMg9]
MRLISPAFRDGEVMPIEVSARDANELPPLEIQEVPDGAQSLALILEDLDSPLGEVTHWLVWNLPPDTHRVDSLHLPSQGRVGLDAFGKAGYLGPIPPEGCHHYRFRLLALDEALDLAPGATRTQFDVAAEGHVLAKADLTGGLCAGTPDSDASN